MNVQILSRILIWLLWLSTLVIALCWLFWENPPFDPEPITVVLGLISTAVTALLSELDFRLREEEFSLPFALAYGYVTNFLEPLISQLLKDIVPGSPKPTVLIFLPEKLSELEPANIERVIGRLRMKSFEEKVINLHFQGGRARDILTVKQSAGNQIFYFDFPNTLFSLNSLVEFRMESRKNSFPDDKKDEMAHKYILRFRQVLEKLLVKKDLADYVRFVDKNLNFA